MTGREPSRVTREAVIKIADCGPGGRGRGGGGQKAVGRCEDQGGTREVSDRNDSQRCSREENPSGNRTGMKQEFAALFKAYRRRGYSGERRLKERRMKLLYQRGLKES